MIIVVKPRTSSRSYTAAIFAAWASSHTSGAAGGAPPPGSCRAATYAQTDAVVPAIGLVYPAGHQAEDACFACCARVVSATSRKATPGNFRHAIRR